MGIRESSACTVGELLSTSSMDRLQAAARCAGLGCNNAAASRVIPANPMLYLVAVVLPPLAVLLAGKPFQAVLSIPLTLLGWVPGVIHALFVVNNHYADKRSERLIRAMHSRS
jgi:uncharacterized membrane protein YqaE (UPF0057 family)